MRKIIIFLLILFISTICLFLFNPFAAPNKNKETKIVVFDSEKIDQASIKLEKEGIIQSFTFFNIASFIKGVNKIEPGGYYLSDNMNTWQVLDEISKGPDLQEIVVYEGMRKEQIGELLKDKLKWDEKKLNEWNNLYRDEIELFEGVYFPDKYLIPVDDSPNDIAKRMISNFNEKFSPLSEEFQRKNIKWTTALKIASLIEREAAGPRDMPLIAGVIWNRLNDNQRLDIDATIQYSLGNKENWWPNLTGADIRNDNSPYNTYKIRGLPPTPISNPGLTSIKAVLDPEETDCLFYLHDRNREIHCSITYEEHLNNIEKYLN